MSPAKTTTIKQIKLHPPEAQMGRTPCCSGEHSALKRGPWTYEEDQKLKNFLLHQPNTSWRLVPQKAGLVRCGKSCRLRWMNYLRPDIRRGNFTEEEEKRIIEIHGAVGNKWSIIAGHLPGRTDNEIKNLWNTKLRKLLVLKGINPITHKHLCNPLLSDYVKQWVKSIENMLIVGLSTTTTTTSASLPTTSNSTNSGNNLEYSSPSPWIPPPVLPTLMQHSVTAAAAAANGGENVQLYQTYGLSSFSGLDSAAAMDNSNSNIEDKFVFGEDEFLIANADIGNLLREEFGESCGEFAGGNLMGSISSAEGLMKYWD